MSAGQLVMEHPLVPHIHTSVATGITREVRSQVKWQGPREGSGDQREAAEDEDAGSNPSHRRCYLIRSRVLLWKKIDLIVSERS